MNDTNVKVKIANHLKEIRKKRSLSLDATAKLTGVSKAMLGQIERGESSPTIAKLWQIASGLNVSFSAFFASDSSSRNDNVFPDDPNMKVTTLFPFASDTSMEMFEITLHNHHQQVSSSHACGVIEHVYVLEGEIDILTEGEWKRLNKGDRFKFFADQQHGYRAVSKTAFFQNIVCYPKDLD